MLTAPAPDWALLLDRKAQLEYAWSQPEQSGPGGELVTCRRCGRAARRTVSVLPLLGVRQTVVRCSCRLQVRHTPLHQAGQPDQPAGARAVRKSERLKVSGEAAALTPAQLAIQSALDKGWTVGGAADAIGAHRGYVYSFLRGRRSTPEAERDLVDKLRHLSDAVQTETRKPLSSTLRERIARLNSRGVSTRSIGLKMGLTTAINLHHKTKSIAFIAALEAVIANLESEV